MYQSQNVIKGLLMRRNLVLILSAALIPAILKAGPLEFTSNEIHGLVNFVETVSGHPHRSPSLKEFFAKSKYNTPETGKKLDEFRQLESDIDQTIEFPGYPVDRHVGINVSQLFLIRSAYSKSLKDFQERTVGLVPMSLQSRYFRLLSYFLPIYRDLVWGPTHKKLAHHILVMKELGKKTAVSDMFNRAKTFYRSDWPEQAEFRLTMVPIPGNKGSARSESLLAFESISVLVDNEDHAQKFSVIFHELCHSLFESQPKEFQKTFEQFFTGSKSRYARYAYHLMNEGLATALGNGWAYKRATGKMNEGSWYDHRYIDQYSKALYPIVEKYVKNSKPIDEAFVAQAIEIFAKTFPESLQDLGNLFTHVSLLSDESVMPARSAAQLMHDSFSVWSMRSRSIRDKEKIFDDLGKETSTLVIMVSPKRPELLEGLPPALLEVLADPKEVFDGRDKIVTGATVNGDVFIVLSAHTEEGIENALRLLKEKGKIEPKLSIIPLQGPT